MATRGVWGRKERAGAALRIRREQMWMSLADVAARTKAVDGRGASDAALQRWERSVGPSAHLEKIKHGYGYYADEVVERLGKEGEAYSNCVHDVHVIGALSKNLKSPKTVRPGTLVYLPESSLHDSALEPMILELLPGGQTTTDVEPHLGEEIVYVVEGQVSLEYTASNGECASLTADEGTLLHFSSTTPHRLLGSATNRNSRVLLIKFPPDRYTQCRLDATCAEVRSAKGKNKRVVRAEGTRR